MFLHRSMSFVVLGVVITLLVVINYYTLRTTSSVRAYISGESLYSKSHKDAARYLITYIATGQESSWQRFYEEIQVPIGDSVARVALTNGDDVAKARAGFLKGRNDIGDVDNMMWLFRYFGYMPFMKQAVSIWKDADADIGKLLRLGVDVRTDVLVGNLSAKEKTILIQKVNALTESLMKKEQAFSATLLSASGSISQTLFYVDIFLTLAIVVIGSRFWITMIRRLTQANQWFEKTLSFGKLGSAVVDHKTYAISLEPELLRLLDFSNPHERLRMSVVNFVEEFVQPRDQVFAERALTLKETNRKREWDAEFHIRSRRGVEKLVNLKTLVAEGESYHLFQDISELRRTELAALERGKMIEHILYSITDGFCAVDKNLRFQLTNPAFEKMSGLTSDVLKGKDLYAVFPAHVKEFRHEKLIEAIQSREAVYFECDYDAVSYSVSAYPNPDGLFLSFRDITEKKKAQAVILQSEQFLANLVANLPGFVYQFEIGERMVPTYFSPQMELITGYRREDFVDNWASTMKALVHPDDNSVFDKVAAALETRSGFEMEFRIKTRSGEERWVSDRGRVVANAQGKLLLEGFVKDITESKRAQFALLEKENRFRKLIRDLQVGVIMHSPDLDILLFNDAASTLLGIDAKDLTNKRANDVKVHIVAEDGSPLFFEQWPVAEARRTLRFVKDALIGVKHGINGRVVWLKVDALPVMDSDGSLMHIISTFTDVTMQKNTEDDLRKLSLIASNTHNSVVFTDLDGRINWVNDGFTKVSGYTLDEVRGKVPGHLLQGKETDPHTVLRIKEALKDGEGIRTEILNYGKDGREYWLDLEIMPTRDSKGELIGFMSIQSDITALKNAINAENEARQILQTIMDHAPMVVFMKDTNGKYLFFNEAYKAAVERPDLVPGMSDFDIFDKNFAEHCQVQDRKIFSGAEVVQYEMQVRGEHFLELKFPVSDRKKRPYAVAGISINVTQSKKLQDAIAESESRFRHIAEAVPAYIWMTDEAGRSVYFNKQWLSFIGRSLDAALQMDINENIHPDDLNKSLLVFNQALEMGGEFRMTYRYKNANGEYRWLLNKGVPRITSDGQYLGYIGSCVDVTESIELNNQLEELVEEKEFLIREIHHRVKNNLQVMSSVLFLKSQTLKDPAMRSLLTESRQRLRSMAMIHERLMQSGGQVTQIDIHDYLTGLINEQKLALSIDPEQIIIEVDIERRMMNLDQVVNIGFIINETFTNAVKYAFPFQRLGLISVIFKRIDDKLTLIVKDNGIGLPSHVTLANTDLFGIQLVKVFTSHLGGKVTLSGSGGTVWKIEF